MIPFRLNLQDDTVILIEDDEETQVCSGFMRGNVWHFEGMGIISEDQDPFMAAIQVICGVLQSFMKMVI